MNHPNRTLVRRAARTLALTPAAVLLTAVTPVMAAAPSQWEEAPAVSPLEVILVLVLIPGGLFLLISLLTYLPSMARGESSYQPGLAWRNEPEWFGGPRGGLERADNASPEALEAAGERGGASGNW